MTDAERMDALRNLFLAGGNVGDGARKVVGFMLSRSWPACKHADIIEAFGTNPSTAWRWIAAARVAELIPAKGQGTVMRADDVNLELLRKLAGR